MMWSDPLLVAARVGAILDNLGVSYLIGGSLASSVYGIPRATQDVDLIAALQLRHVDPLISSLGIDFYVSQEATRTAIRDAATFNVVHLATMFKVDIFVAREDPWIRSEFDRARLETIGGITLRFAAPEDVLLHKILWYKMGNEVSDRQWNDVLGILRIQAANLDEAYLTRWASHLGVAPLLDRARGEAGPQV